MFEDLQLVELLEADAGIDGERPPGPRMRKIGGIVSCQLSDEFAALEAAFMRATDNCVVCEGAPRADGRLLCEPCQKAARPPKLTDAEREARKAASFAIARARAKAGEKARTGFFWL